MNIPHQTSSAYGDALAHVYDLMYPTDESSATVEFLASLVDARARVIEFGAGTGRIAVPLADKGFTVYAVDASTRMLEKLRERDGQDKVRTVCADFTKHVEDGGFDLCYIVWNTLFMVTDPELQITTLRNAARHLRPEGTLVVDVYDPTHFHQLTKPEYQARHLAADKIMIDTVNVDNINQVVFELHTLIEPGAVSSYTEVSRYAWPPELDLMARIAGLRHVDRFSDWNRSPQAHDTLRHIALYRKAA